MVLMCNKLLMGLILNMSMVTCILFEWFIEGAYFLVQPFTSLHIQQTKSQPGLLLKKHWVVFSEHEIFVIVQT